MAERVASVGYAALGKETTKGTAVTPAVYVPYFDQDISTDMGLQADTPIIGGKFATYQALEGMRSHKGNITFMAEPNTAAYLCDMLLTKISTTGTNPYTHTFGFSATTDPNSYTLDLALGGGQVVRFFGLQASKMTPSFQGDELQFQMSVSALGSFYAREIASVATSTITLTTTYDTAPTTGLVNSDLVAIKKVDGSVITNFTVSSFTSTTVTLNATAAAFSAGDMLVLRPATPSYTIQTPFLWPNTQWCFGATASAALSAAQTRLESGSAVEIMHAFESDDGAQRSGAYDPASLVRTVGSGTFKIKQYFDLPDQEKFWMATSKNACVLRCYSTGTTYEFRVTFNNLRLAKNPTKTKFNEVVYQEEEYMPTFDTSDSAAIGIVVINAVSTI